MSWTLPLCLDSGDLLRSKLSLCCTCFCTSPGPNKLGERRSRSKLACHWVRRLKRLKKPLREDCVDGGLGMICGGECRETERKISIQRKRRKEKRENEEKVWKRKEQNGIRRMKHGVSQKRKRKQENCHFEVNDVRTLYRSANQNAAGMDYSGPNSPEGHLFLSYCSDAHDFLSVRFT